MWGMIATWTMAKDGVNIGKDILKSNGSCHDALIQAIKDVEDCPYYKSVGYGGLPNEDMEVELDGGFMDGDTLSLGCVGAIKNFASPIEIAYQLSKEKVNNMLVGRGAEKYAMQHGFECKNMLTDRAKKYYFKRIKEEQQELHPYIGHDTVGVVALDTKGSMCVGTSTSGLFMKRQGRVGDSPIIGSGYYCDSEVGGASATGLGEDLMKGCISYEIVRLMKDGYTPQEACDKAVKELNDKLERKRESAGDLSVIALNNKGEWGVATNIDTFSFVVATEKEETTVYTTKNVNGHSVHTKAGEEFIQKYYAARHAPVE